MDVNARMQQIIGAIQHDDRNKVTIPRLYLTICRGDYVVAMVFKEIAYWSGSWANNEDKNGWWYRNAAMWEAEAFISYKQLSRAITRLNEIAPGMIDRKVRKVNNERCMFFRLIPEVFVPLMEKFSAKQNPTRNIPNGNLHANIPNGNLQTAQTAISLPTPVTVSPVPTRDTKRDSANRDDAPSRRATYDPDRHRAKVYADPKFQRFWNRYPRNDGKAAAAAAWYRLNPSDELIAQMHAALDWQEPHWKRTETSIPHFATWLNNYRWEDDRPQSTSKNGNPDEQYGEDARRRYAKERGIPDPPEYKGRVSTSAGRRNTPQESQA